MPVRVSVVVPVYNPGPYLDPLVDSLLRQTLPPEEFEAVFVDDGSTDDTPARLDALAARHPHFRVVHIPNSGWPGRPRNVGVDHARGAYVQFVDNDDWLGPEALRRLCDYAEEHGSDIVVGKEVRWPGRPQPFGAFSANRPHARIGVDPLLSPLTPHKMFRREFLLRHGLRFPEGPRRLEDHPFVTRAYFLADVVSVLADYPCYTWHRREGNAGSRPRVWTEWYSFLEEALDVVEEHTDPGDVRDALLSYWYLEKVVRLASKIMANPDPGPPREFFDAAADLVRRRFPPRLDRLLHGLELAHAHFIRTGDHDGLRALVRWEKELRVEVRGVPRLAPDGVFALDVEATVHDAGGPVAVEETADGRVLLRPPAAVPALPLQARDLTALEDLTAALVLENWQDGDVHTLRAPVRFRVVPGPRPDAPTCRLEGTFRLDPERLAAGGPLPAGGYALVLRLARWGRSMLAAVEPAERLGPVAPLTLVGDVRHGTAVSHVGTTKKGRLRLVVGRPPLDVLLPARGSRAARLEPRPDGCALVVPTDRPTLRGAPLRGRAFLEGPSGRRPAALRLEERPGADGVLVTVGVPGDLPAGTHAVTAVLGGQPLDLGLAVEVRGHGGHRLLAADGEPVSTLEPARGSVLATIRRRLAGPTRSRSSAGRDRGAP